MTGRGNQPWSPRLVLVVGALLLAAAGALILAGWLFGLDPVVDAIGRLLDRLGVGA